MKKELLVLRERVVVQELKAQEDLLVPEEHKEDRENKVNKELRGQVVVKEHREQEVQVEELEHKGQKEL